jgi:hypothetical protein
VAFWRTCCLFQDGEQGVPGPGRRWVWLGVLVGILVILAVAGGRTDQTRTPKLEAPDRLEHWPLKASRSVGGLIEDAAAADRKALSTQASARLKHLELRNSGQTDLGSAAGAFSFF